MNYPRNAALKNETPNNFKNHTASTQTIYKNNSEKNYTRLDNKTLRICLAGDSLNAKDIWLDALSCVDNWLVTTKNTAKRYNIHPKKAQRLLNRCVKNGVAERIKVTDPDTGKFVMQYYIFYETPLDRSCPAEKSKTSNAIECKKQKISTGQKLSSDTLYKKKQKKEQITPTKKPPGPLPKPQGKNRQAVLLSDINKFELEYEYNSHKETLNDLSQKIIDAKPKDRKIRFNPKTAIESHINAGTSVKILLIALEKLAKPKAWKKTRSNGYSLLNRHIEFAKKEADIERQNQNERDSINEHEKRKRLDREFCKNGQFPFNDHGEIGDKIQWN